MNQIAMTVRAQGFTHHNTEVLKRELIRKFIHLTIGLTPILASFSYVFTVILLSVGTIAYSVFEYMRHAGVKIAFVSEITEYASRDRDKGRFVLGPITLGMGALMALLLYPSPAASLAIYALAFGDGLSSLIGKAFGRIRLPLLSDKTLIGSATCFLSVFIASFAYSRNIWVNFIIAFTATFLEALPLKDIDNIAIPVGTGLVATLLLRLL